MVNPPVVGKSCFNISCIIVYDGWQWTKSEYGTGKHNKQMTGLKCAQTKVKPGIAMYEI